MSEMNLDVAVRAFQKNKTVPEIYKQIKSDPLFKIDDCDNYYRSFDENEDSIYHFIFNSEDLDIRMRVIEIEKKVFFDFLLSEDSDGYSIDETFTPSQFEVYKKILNDLNLESEDLRFRVFYYYNGGCAGLTECI
jgi:hypothetical protein